MKGMEDKKRENLESFEASFFSEIPCPLNGLN